MTVFSILNLCFGGLIRGRFKSCLVWVGAVFLVETRYRTVRSYDAMQLVSPSCSIPFEGFFVGLLIPEFRIYAQIFAFSDVFLFLL